MRNWVRANVTPSTIIVLITAGVSLTIQWGTFQRSVQDVELIRRELALHRANTSIHIDRYRDQQIQRNLENKIEELQRRVDELTREQRNLR